MQRALFIEPSFAACCSSSSHAIFLHTGDYRRAIGALSNLIESGPDFSIARRHRAQAFILNGQPAEALADLLLLPQDRAEDIALRLPLLARAYAECGDTERAEDDLWTLLEMSRTEFVVGFNLATVAVGLGRLEEALDASRARFGEARDRALDASRPPMVRADRAARAFQSSAAGDLAPRGARS